MSRRDGPVVVTIFWRDIPAQVNGQSGRERHQVMLSSKFQRAVDRAKRKAHIYTADEDIAQWRRVSVACDGDIVAAAEAEVERLEVAYSREFLGRLAYAGGYEADVNDDEVDREELLALEELDEADDTTDPADTDTAGTADTTGTADSADHNPTEDTR